MAIVFTIITIALLIGIVITAIITFRSGKEKGIQQEKMLRLEAEKEYHKKLFTEESMRKELQREVDNLRRDNDRYIQFLISIPEIVKNLISNLSFEETVPSIFRLIKSLVDPEIIKLYMFERKTNSLVLIVAHGADSGEKNVIKFGEGMVGVAAKTGAMVLRTSLQVSGVQNADTDDIDIAAPILFKDKLIGVMGLGKIKERTGDEKRFISIVADLAGISLQNVEFLEIAKEEAVTDALTTLHNRRYFFDRAREATRKAITYNSPLSIFIFDIDHFKRYNDMNGHAEGDYLLKELSQLLKENSRGIDVIARYGGEEFIVLMSDTDKDGASRFAEKMRRLIENFPFKHKEKQPSGYVSISGGVATFPFDGNSVDTVIRHADEALYESKRSGRNRITRYEPFLFSQP